MSTLRVSNIEAKADPSSPSIDEKLKVTNSNGDVLVQIDGKTVGVTTVGINTTDKSFAIDNNQNVEFLGIVTATKFSLSGGGEITGGDGNFTGIVTASSLNVTGNVSIAGTLTYEDVTSIDSVGIITAQSDVIVGAGLSVVGISTLANTNINGQLTATNARITGVTTFGTSSTTINGAHEYPSIRPTLDLNFAATKTLDRRITFTRDGVGTYVGEDGLIKYAPNNTPRFDHDPVTGESLGLLIEESRTNEIINSRDLSYWDSAYGSSVEVVQTDTAIAPDGTQTADSMLGDGGSGRYTIRFSQTLATSTQFTFSVFVKKIQGVRYCSLETASYTTWSNSGILVFDLDTGTLLSNNIGGNQGGGIEQYANGWYRIYGVSTTSTDGGNSGFYLNFALSDGSSTLNPGPATNEGLYVWGAQVEAGSFPTSYIPTSGSTVTRNKDITVIKGTNFTNVFDTNFKEFSAVMDYNNLDTVASGGSNGLLILWGESSGYDDRVSVSSDNDTVNTAVRTRAFGSGSGIFTNGDQIEASSQAATQKFAFSYSVPDYSNSSSRRWAFCFSGETPIDLVPNNSGSTVPALTRLGIGINPTRLDESGGKLRIKQLAIYPKALPDSQLQGLTAQ